MKISPNRIGTTFYILNEGTSLDMKRVKHLRTNKSLNFLHRLWLHRECSWSCTLWCQTPGGRASQLRERSCSENKVETILNRNYIHSWKKNRTLRENFQKLVNKNTIELLKRDNSLFQSPYYRTLPQEKGLTPPGALPPGFSSMCIYLRVHSASQNYIPT